MLKNYFKVVWRNIRKHRLYTFINLTGLSVGIACCTLIFLYVQNELSYDKYNKNFDQIYRLTEVLHLPTENNARALSSPPMAPALKANFPEVLKAVRISYSSRYLAYGEKKIADAEMMYADSSFFDVFTFPAVRGDLKTALIQPYSIVLTESMAKKYFGSASPVGQTMQLSDTIPLTVTAVVKDVPAASHFRFDCVLSRSTINAMNGNGEADAWFYNGFYTYLLLPKDINRSQLEKKFTDFIGAKMAKERKESGLYYDLKLQPLGDIHLKSNLASEIKPNSDITYVYIFSAAALLILLIACINFVNLSTAKSINRAKEIGLRKVIGASRRQLLSQFLGESFLFAFLAMLLALILVQLALPKLNELTGNTLSVLRAGPSSFAALLSGLILCIGLLAGLYPALLLSSFSPIKALKGLVKYEWQDVFMRKGLVVFQFVIAIVLITGAAFVYQQLQFLQSRKIGLNKEQLLEVEIPASYAAKKNVLLSELKSSPAVVNASLTGFTFKESVNTIATIPEGAPENEVSSVASMFVDDHFLETFQVKLLAGRNFSSSFPTDSTEAFLVNEAAVKAFGWKSNEAAIGKKITWSMGKKGKVIGVVQDFNFTSLHDAIKPLLLTIYPEECGYVALRIKPQEMQQTLSELSAIWKTNVPDADFQYSFLDEDFAALYKSEQNLQTVLGWFTAISIFIACLGLFGLASFTIEQRFKEIAIRKVVGASISSIVSLLSMDFLKLVFIAICFALPVAWFGVHQWIQNFAYRISLSWTVFFAAGVAALLIAFLTTGFQAIKAALVNPVKKLRSE